MLPPPYPLLIDDRAGSRDLMEHLSIPAELARLDFGDAMIVGNGPADSTVIVGVEVKSVSDLLQSMSSGRLQGHQVPGMLELYDVNWLLYYGGVRSGSGGELQVRRGKGWTNFRVGTRAVPYSYLEGFLLDLSCAGVRSKHVYDSHEAAKWLEVVHRWWSKPWSAHKALRAFDNSKEVSLLPGLSAEEMLLARAAAVLPGIGFERACAVAAHFVSIEDMLVADWAEWASIPGIGKVVAKSVVTAIQQKVR